MSGCAVLWPTCVALPEPLREHERASWRVTRRRLDAELVRRGMARSREQAQDFIAAGRVLVGGAVAHKAATQVDAAEAVVVSADGSGTEGYVSRGAHKLLGALAAFTPQGLMVSGRVALDAGASTGGFTEVLLRAGVARVIAVDVGYGQLAWPLRQDPRVDVIERTNVRTLTADAVPARPEVVVADLSFISLALVLPALHATALPEADHVLMVKPQFEVGRSRVGAGGVVRDPAVRAQAVTAVARVAYGLGLGTAGVTASPLPGPSGNVEYFLWLRAGAPALGQEALDRAIEEGPR